MEAATTARQPSSRDEEGLRSAGGAERATALVVHVAALALAVATVVLAGQPLYANDTWIHLALGEAFAEHGPWLSADPHLFTAPGPPSPSSWLGSLSIYAVHLLTGFTGLRIAHAALCAAVLLLAWRVMRSAGSSPLWASAGMIGFIALSTYRVVQLRPELFTLAATLSLHLLLIADARGPSPRRIALAALLSAVWANVHAAFLLGPILVLGASAAVAVTAAFEAYRAGSPSENGEHAASSDFMRARRLALAGFAMLGASAANPQGFTAHLAYFTAGRETFALQKISDEWNPTNLLAWPVPSLPPTWAAWIVCWVCVLALGAAVVVFVRDLFGRAPSDGGLDAAAAGVRTVDPALLGIAGAGLLAAAQASRFLWLGVFALALAGTILTRRAPPILTRTAGLAFALGAAFLHWNVGDWPLLSRALLAEGSSYRVPYSAERFNSEPIWFLADSGLEGRIFNDYPLGGFMSFWLAPRLAMASSGTMNVRREAMDANLAIASRQGVRQGESFEALLDRMGFDLFLGLGLPVEATPGRPVPCSVRHLEHSPGWVLVYRNLRSAVYLRRNAHNARNLERVAAYYARAGVPFEPARGFDVERVIREATPWALEHGLIPEDFEALLDEVRSARAEGRMDLQIDRLSILFAALGLYERALDLDRAVLRDRPGDPVAAWRVIWNLLQLSRWKDAMATAEALERRAAEEHPGQPSPWAGLLASIRATDPAARLTLIAHLPVVRNEQIDWLRHGIAIAPPRWRKNEPRG